MPNSYGPRAYFVHDPLAVHLANDAGTRTSAAARRPASIPTEPFHVPKYRTAIAAGSKLDMTQPHLYPLFFEPLSFEIRTQAFNLTSCNVCFGCELIQ